MSALPTNGVMGRPRRIPTPAWAAERQHERIRTGGGRATGGWPWGGGPWSASCPLPPEPHELRTNPDARRRAAELMLADPAAKAGFLQKVLGVAQLDLSVAPDDEKSPADAAAAEFCQYAINRRLAGGVRGLVESVLLHLLPEGKLLLEPVWRTNPDGTPELETRGKWVRKHTLKTIKPKPPGSYDLVTDRFLNVNAVKYTDGQGEKQVSPIHDFLFISYLSRYNDPDGWADLEAGYKAYLMKDAAITRRKMFQDNLSGPFLTIFAQDPNDPKVLASAERARGCGILILNHNDLSKVENLAGASDETFSKAIADYDRQILIGIVGAYLHILEGVTPQGAGDTREHRGITELFMWHLSALISGLLTEQLGPILVDENFAGAGYPLFTLEGVDPADQKQRLELLGMAGDRIETSKKQWREMSGAAKPVEDDPGDVVPARSAAPTGAVGAFPFGELTLEEVTSP